MTYFITIEELKQTTFNANLDNEYIAPALEEAQSIYLREIIGDLLYTAITNKIDDETLSGKYLTLVNQYIKPYLTYKVQSVIVIPLNNKTRNAGVINQYDQGFNTSTMKDTAYLADYYNSRAEFYANRLTTYLQKNSADFPEYGYSDDNITQPTESQNVTTIYLGGGRKKGCGCTPSSGGGSSSSVDWDDIQNRPDFAEVATSGSYNDLEDTPEIPTVNDATINIYQGSTLKGSFSLNQENGQDINLDAGGGGGSTDWSDITNKPNFATVATSGDYNDLQNKPTIPTVPTNVSAFNNDAGYITSNDLPTVNNSTIEIYQGNTLKGSFTLNQSSGETIQLDAGGGGGSVDWSDITNKPTLYNEWFGTQQEYNAIVVKDPDTIYHIEGASQIQTDWNQSDSTAVDYIKNKPNLSTVATSGDYNDLQNKPNIPTVNNATLTIKQGGTTKGTFTANAGTDVEINLEAGGGGGSTDWSDITNKPNFATVATSGDYDDLTNKPTIPTVPTNVSAFNNDAGYTTFDGDYNSLTNKPTIPAAQVNSDWNANSGVAQILNKPSLATVATTGDYSDLTNKPNIPAAQVNSDWNAVSGVAQILNKPSIPANTSDLNNDSGFITINDVPAQVNADWNSNTGASEILNKPSLATVATTGNYSDLNGTPTIPAAQVQSDWNEADTSSKAYIANKPTIPAAQVQSDWNANSGMGQILNKPSLSTVATSGDYNDLQNKPTIPVVPSYTTETWEFLLSDNTTITKTIYLVPSV